MVGRWFHTPIPPEPRIGYSSVQDSGNPRKSWRPLLVATRTRPPLRALHRDDRRIAASANCEGAVTMLVGIDISPTACRIIAKCPVTRRVEGFRGGCYHRSDHQR